MDDRREIAVEARDLPIAATCPARCSLSPAATLCIDLMREAMSKVVG
ncbi:hypothetical protein [Rhizorhabdus dicambivorans]|jgi:hypothetical protein|nr:hypothetical protein [Rhizorhabdus dicambivorans]